ncbi:hypothetical protein NEIMUCOT_04244 [Neisseria mucosa ATCC 25996]|uniref:Uncharacterized protein n=1 Tax=Neisseria mucosa (strain ATCC 25996 / DSM 4631 / NCTC 10774 / M26) TaxID=546266 RepID=D2ZUF6_NEIM2|nr:hypothetical protein NEIMUCOT_04244 [Neisseria mucosa ATCC 25996]
MIWVICCMFWTVCFGLNRFLYLNTDCVLYGNGSRQADNDILSSIEHR